MQNPSILPAKDINGLVRCASIVNDGLKGYDHPGRVLGLKNIPALGNAESAGSDNIVGDLKKGHGVFHLGTTRQLNKYPDDILLSQLLVPEKH